MIMPQTPGMRPSLGSSPLPCRQLAELGGNAILLGLPFRVGDLSFCYLEEHLHQGGHANGFNDRLLDDSRENHGQG